MSAGRQGKTTNTLDDVIGTKINDAVNSLWGEMPGQVVSFDPVKQTATIQPLFKPKHNGVPVTMPELLEVPVRFPRTGTSAQTSPIKAGDKVSLRPQMRSTENYHTEGDGAASDARAFSLSDMEAHLAGGESLNDPLPNFDNENTHIRANAAGTHGVKLSPDGKLEIKGSQGDVFKMLAQVVRLLAEDQLVINYGSSAGTGHQLSNRAAYLEIADKLDAMSFP